MKKIYNVFALLVVALVGLSLTACSEDDYDTNPYNKSGVNLLAFGTVTHHTCSGNPHYGYQPEQCRQGGIPWRHLGKSWKNHKYCRCRS